MGYEVPVVSADLVNGAFLDKIFTAGQVKQAEEVASMYIRQRLYEDGILRRLFDHRVVEADLLLNGLDDVVKMPHSRYSGIDEALVRQKQELKILLEGQESGISVLKDSQDVFVLGHLEYAHNTLQEEYERDLAKGLPISAPEHYYDASGAPVCSWRSSASVFFANWLNFSVYQVTPFVL